MRDKLANECYNELVNASMEDRATIIRILETYMETYRGEAMMTLLQHRNGGGQTTMVRKAPKVLQDSRVRD